MFELQCTGLKLHLGVLEKKRRIQMQSLHSRSSSAETTIALYFDSCKETVGQSMESSSLHLKMAMDFVYA
ncbi:hypothetical protein MHYP_G00280820 [Metynnis hypsauchen]